MMYRGLMKLASELKDPDVRTVAMITPNDELGVYSGE